MTNEQGRGGNRDVAVVIGATSKWQADGRNTRLVHGDAVDDSELPVGARWGIGGAIAQRFAAKGMLTVLTTRRAANAAGLEAAIGDQGGACLTVELDLTAEESIASAFARIRREAGQPTVVVYNAGYLEGRDLPPEMELMENIPTELFDTAMHIASRGPFLVAKEVLPAMREAGRGTLLFTNNSASLRGRKRHTGQSLYYPRTIMRALAQALTEEYSEHGVHVANVVVDGLIDSPGTRALPIARERPDVVMDPVEIADAFFYLHRQHRSVWTHELQLTPHVTRPSF
jgi:NAD(P)-dependent dehydrogenase (short-subunit alcohol dehydrogenase family)